MMSSAMALRSRNGFAIYTGICPDEKCRTKLYFPLSEETIVCNQCGQRHRRGSLENVEEITDIETVFQSVLRGVLMRSLPKRGTEAVKVLGLSNYHCKLLSPLLTTHGMDKETGKAKRLSEMNQGDIFDCGLFGDRAFLIDPEHIAIPGFGRDVSGSVEYLQSTLDLIKAYNKNEEHLVPIHSDGDGHCLVHAISRALVGRELFWHPLRCSLKKHLEDNLVSYQALFKDFVDESDWMHIINECDPEFLPREGDILGLRNIHVFGLANVLKRPIILLDSEVYMDKKADYAALFLPSIVDPELCKGKGKDRALNKPLCIAWSSVGHNHYIPLVGIKKSTLPVLPKRLLPKVWGVPQEDVLKYIEFDNNDCCTIGGDRSLGDPYILRLVSAMEELFFQLHSVHPNVVADMHHYLYSNSGSGLRPRDVIDCAKNAVRDGRLYRCLTCNAINEQVLPPQFLKKTGLLYNMALRSHGTLNPEQLYAFHSRGIYCTYDAQKDELVPNMELCCLENCCCCEGSSLRKVQPDGSIIYKNGDRTKTASKSTLCRCGYKHYWNGKEYDNLPQELTVNLEWSNRLIKDTVTWFQNETDSTLNSNVYDVASAVLDKHFPGEFGSERLVQRVVDQILDQTKPPEPVTIMDSTIPSPSKVLKDDSSPTKIVLVGSGILHKEELGVSCTEQRIRRRIETRSHHQQKMQQTHMKQEPTSVSSIKTNTSKTESPDSSPIVVSNPSGISSKSVKIVTSDGRQGTLEFGDGITFEVLQKWICDNFQIDPENQKIKHGFPLKEINASLMENGSLLSLSPGERIVVEITRSTILMQDTLVPGFSSVMPEKTDWEKVKDTLRLDSNSYALLDARIIQFHFNANLIDLSNWEYAQRKPEVFDAGGIFYEQMKRDLGLDDRKHGHLPAFPGKVFVYNQQNDRLEVCFEPYGHYPIVEGIEEKVLRNITEEKNATYPFNASNCSGPAKKHPDRVPFQGTGYMLKDPGVAFTKKGNSSGDNLQAPHNLQSPPPSVLVRKGPGVSVLSVGNSPSIPDLSRLQGLAQQVVEDSLLHTDEIISGTSSSKAGEAMLKLYLKEASIKAELQRKKNIPAGDTMDNNLLLSPEDMEPSLGTPTNSYLHSPKDNQCVDDNMDCDNVSENKNLTEPQKKTFRPNHLPEQNVVATNDSDAAMDIDTVAT